MAFTPRYVRPDYLTEPYYRRYGYGDGLNFCIVINSETGEVMPNCTGYAWGRAYEITGDMPRLSVRNGYQWFGDNTYYQTGNVPALGAVICYSGGTSGLGHVAVVEEIDWENRTITCSNSAYGNQALYFFLTHLSMDNMFAYYNYNFQGFIYVYEQPTPPTPTKKKMPLIYYARNVRR